MSILPTTPCPKAVPLGWQTSRTSTSCSWSLCVPPVESEPPALKARARSHVALAGFLLSSTKILGRTIQALRAWRCWFEQRLLPACASMRIATCHVRPHHLRRWKASSILRPCTAGATAICGKTVSVPQGYHDCPTLSNRSRLDRSVSPGCSSYSARRCGGGSILK
jgi:hypothetical protein